MRAIDYFDKGAEANPDRSAMIAPEGSCSYREMRAATENLARALWACGLRDQEPAGIYSENDPRVLSCMLGIMRAGALWVPINYRNALDANVEYMNYVEMAWLFYHSQFRESVHHIKQRVASLRGLICLDRDEGGNPSLEAFTERAIGKVPDWGDAYGNPDRPTGLVPTGGTTGPAKGVRVTNLALGTMAELATHYWLSDVEHPVCLTTAPLSHAAGVLAFVMCSVGATNVIMPKFEALEVLRNIERYRITHLYLPPTALYNLLAHPEVGNFDYSSLRGFLLAGSPVAPDKLRKAVEVFGPCMCQSYGQTEAPMILTFLDSKTVAAAAAGEHPERLASCGKPTMAVRLAIMDEAGRILARGEAGEIVARGSLVCGGYYKLPEATAEIRAHGWHHTGDIGYMDEDGYVYIVDRKKDMIISGGFNVYCAEVEAAIMAMPEVHECAVIGVPHDKWGEAVKAFIVLHPGVSLSEAAVITYCKQRLGGVKTPKSIEFCDEIYKTAAGKIDRKRIRAPYWRNAARQVH